MAHTYGSDTEATSLVDFIQTIKATRSPEGRKRYEAQRRLEEDYATGWHTVEKAAMSENGGGLTGGYLIPPEMSHKLLRVLAEESIIWPRATIVPMNTRTLQAPLIDEATASGTAGVPSFFGNVQFKWGSEQAPSETEPKFRQLDLTAWDLLGYMRVSNQFLQDIGSEGEDALFTAIGKAAAWYAEYAFFNGTGISQPLGLINSPALKTITIATADTIAAADVGGMAAALLPYSWRRAIWAAHPSCMSTLEALANYRINASLPIGAEADSPTPAGFLSSRPLYITDKLQPLSNGSAVISLMLFDPSLYVIGNRQEVLIDVSSHSRFGTYQTELRVWCRLDGKTRLSSVVTLQDQTTVVSPYVALMGK